MKKFSFKKLQVLLVDVLLYVIGILISFVLRFHGSFPTANFIPTLHMLPIFILTFLILANIYNLYSEYQKYDDTIASLACVLLITCFVNMAATFLLRQFSVPRTIFFLFSITQFILIGCWRIVVWKKSLLIDQVKTAIIIGFPREIHTLRQNVTRALSQGICIVQEIHLHGERADEFFERWHKLKEQAVLQRVNTLILCASVPIEYRSEIFDFAIRGNKTIMLVPGIYELLLQNARLISAGDMPVIQLQGMETPPYLSFIKRIIDIVISIPALIILSPVMFFIAVAIKLDSPGPVFYIQTRIGLKNKEIRICKFRTMYADAEKYSGPALAEENDPRITRTGRFLRKTRLDEIPQFWNVLKGDMSLVGPRPEREYFISEYTKEVPEFSYRTNIKAGITGLAQVEGNYTTNPENKLKYDLFYAQNQSLANDLVILMRTAKVIFLKDKAL